MRILPFISAGVLLAAVGFLVVVGALPLLAGFLSNQIEAFVPPDLQAFVATAIGVGATVAILTLLPIFFIWFERKVAAHTQDRLGPMRVGWHGVLQSFADGIKLIFKEDIIPENADRPLFKLAPYLVVVGTFAAFAVIPWGADLVLSDLNIGLLYIVAITSLNSIGLLMAGWASDNKYSLYGGMRSAAQMVSYEIPTVLTLLVVVVQVGIRNLQDIISAQSG
jgi:NADH-quinone oxidoreductase subunit H